METLDPPTFSGLTQFLLQIAYEKHCFSSLSKIGPIQHMLCLVIVNLSFLQTVTGLVSCSVHVMLDLDQIKQSPV